MKLPTAVMFLCVLCGIDAFVSVPRSYGVIIPRSHMRTSSACSRSAPTKMSALPSAASTISTAAAVIQSSATVLASAGMAEPGSVDAPMWVLPAGAGAVILLAGAIPLLLKPGDDAAKDMQERDQDAWQQNMK